MTVDILVLQSTFNLHTIRCFLYLICYLGVAVDDTPQGGNALDADEQFLDYSHILTRTPDSIWVSGGVWRCLEALVDF